MSVKNILVLMVQITQLIVGCRENVEYYLFEEMVTTSIFQIIPPYDMKNDGSCCKQGWEVHQDLTGLIEHQKIITSTLDKINEELNMQVFVIETGTISPGLLDTLALHTSLLIQSIEAISEKYSIKSRPVSIKKLELLRSQWNSDKSVGMKTILLGQYINEIRLTVNELLRQLDLLIVSDDRIKPDPLFYADLIPETYLNQPGDTLSLTLMDFQYYPINPDSTHFTLDGLELEEVDGILKFYIEGSFDESSGLTYDDIITTNWMLWELGEQKVHDIPIRFHIQPPLNCP